MLMVDSQKKATNQELLDELSERIFEFEEKEKKADADWSTSSFIAGLAISSFFWLIVLIVTHGR